MQPRWFRLLKVIDQFFNVLILNGHEDVTISGRVGYKAYTTKEKKWIYAERFINALFFWDHNHCFNSIEWDRAGKY